MSKAGAIPVSALTISSMVDTEQDTGLFGRPHMRSRASDKVACFLRSDQSGEGVTEVEALSQGNTVSKE